MEVAKGAGVSVPPLATYPPEHIRSKISTEDWQTFLQAWISSIEYRLKLNTNLFARFNLSDPTSGIYFLSLYLRHFADRTKEIQSGSSEAKLHQYCYMLLKRLLLETKTPYDCSALVISNLLGSSSIAFRSISDWRATLKLVWKRNFTQVKSAIETCKNTILKASDSNLSDLLWHLRCLTALIRCLPESSVVAVAGSDYLEGILAAYGSLAFEAQQALTESMYYCFRSLMTDVGKHASLLLDIIFEISSWTAQHEKSQLDLLSSIICTTPLIRHLKADPAISDSKRGQMLIQSLSELKQMRIHLYPVNLHASKGKKGKDQAHVHRASQMSQIHDLFPDLPNGYILRLLTHFSDDVEAAIAALLEPESLPPTLRAPSIDDNIEIDAMDEPLDLAPRSTPPLLPERKNIFDNDEFDRLQISTGKLHKGRRAISEQPQTSEEHSRSKAAIMAALAAFDADDDERDDTYDVADVGGAVDNTIDSDEKRNRENDEKVEELLFRAWLANPELFGRESKTRLLPARKQLSTDTSMGNEQIEGWAIMLKRDPSLQDRLKQRYSTTRSFQGHQQALSSTKWNGNVSPPDSQDEASDSRNDSRRMGAVGIRGVRKWNHGRGRGSPAGPTDDHATQMARKRKEQGRGRGGATHRKQGRAKKMGRGMGPVNP